MDSLAEISAGINRNAKDTRALAERVDYLTVAVFRGDPRFTKAEHVTPGFDAAAFDAEWQARGKRVPTMDEVFGG